jgi:hypothetical protein
MKCSAVLFSVALVVALATGCSGGSGAQPSTLPTLTGPAPTASPAAVPEAAKAKTPQGADAFVRFFFSQLNVAFASSDSASMLAYANSECLTCGNYATGLDAAKKADHFFDGDSFEVQEVAARPLESLGTLVEVYGTLPARTQVNAAGAVLKKLPAEGRFHFTVAVKRQEAGWLVSGIRLGS